MDGDIDPHPTRDGSGEAPAPRPVCIAWIRARAEDECGWPYRAKWMGKINSNKIWI